MNEAVAFIQLRFGEHLIDLVPAGPGPTEGGLDHLCLSIRCDDLAALAESLRRYGVPLDGEILSRRGAYGTGPSLYLRDPDGHQIELKPR